jgi:hypothetical protein
MTFVVFSVLLHLSLARKIIQVALVFKNKFARESENPEKNAVQALVGHH